MACDREMILMIHQSAISWIDLTLVAMVTAIDCASASKDNIDNLFKELDARCSQTWLRTETMTTHQTISVMFHVAQPWVRKIEHAEVMWIFSFFFFCIVAHSNLVRMCVNRPNHLTSITFTKISTSTKKENRIIKIYKSRRTDRWRTSA